MKSALLIASLALSVPAVASAGEIDQQVQVASSYVYERQAEVVSTNPVVNYTATVDEGSGLASYVFVQVGDVLSLIHI